MNFKLIKTEELKDIKSIGYYYQHEKTKAKVIILKNNDKNLVFKIKFLTLLDNSTGIAHILEHSVFSGSKKYPSKNILTDLKTTGILSLLNASTYRTFTNFYFSTYYSTKFIEVMDIYLDMVFNPLIYKNDYTFKREGIRLDFDKDDKLIFNGIVFNEMKGTLNKGRIIYNEIYKNLFPNSVYKYDSGGDVEEMFNLNNDKLKEFHKKNYHPSNSITYLYGDINIEDSLNKLDEYFSNYEEKNIDNNYGKFEKIKEKNITVEVPKEKENKIDLVLALHIEKFKFKTVLPHFFSYLTDKTSLLHKMLIASSLVNNIDCGGREDHLNYLMFGFYGIEEKNIDKVLDIFRKTLKEVSKKGLDKEKLDAYIKRIIFNDKKEVLELNPYKGLALGDLVLSRVLLNKDDIFKYLRYEEDIKIKRTVTDKDFSDFIENSILNNKDYIVLKCIPKDNLSKVTEEKLEENLRKIESKITEEEKIKIRKLNEKLKQENNSIVNFPKLSLDDITKTIPVEQVKVEKINNIKYLFYEADTLRINQVSLMFDIKHLDKDLFMYLILYTKLLKSIATNNYSLKDLLDKINSLLGSFNVGFDLYNNYKNDKEYKHYLNFKSEYLEGNVNNFIEIFDELIFNQDFQDIKNIKNVIKKLKLSIENLYKDPQFLINNFTSYKLNYSNRILKTITFQERYEFFSYLLDNFNSKYEEFIKNMNEIKEKVFNKENMIITFIGNKEDYQSFKESIDKYLIKLNNKHYEEIVVEKKENIKRKAFIIDQKVNYIEEGFKLITKVEDSLLCNIITNKYLTKKIRIDNGAYGAWASNMENYITLNTYRDPKLKETLSIFKELPNFIKNLDLTEEELNNYKILTNNFDNPKSIFVRGNIAINNYLSYVDIKELQEDLDIMFSMSLKDLRKKSEVYEKGLKESILGVASSKETVKENEELFEEVEDFINE